RTAPGALRMLADSPAHGAGRYAPSPSGDLHLGNLRTAVLAWVLARRSGRSFHLRVEDLDRVREGAEQRQIEDLAALGIDWDGEVVRQSERGQAHEAAVQSLSAQGMVFECYCTRREILEAPGGACGALGASRISRRVQYALSAVPSSRDSGVRPTTPSSPVSSGAGASR